MSKEIKMVSLEELKAHLETLVPKLKPNQKPAKDEELRLDALLDIYNWAKEKSK